MKGKYCSSTGKAQLKTKDLEKDFQKGCLSSNEKGKRDAHLLRGRAILASKSVIHYLKKKERT
jgi:hypothetical protein